MEIRVDVDRLRNHLEDEYGTAAFNGSPAAISDMWDISHLDGYELCKKAEELGVDLNDFRPR
ncbi:MAG: hypothetical protein IKG21_05700 [Atopobiaceae bacterium]|nr:hypothetical protein [Atopobiaceae bacterium]